MRTSPQKDKEFSFIPFLSWLVGIIVALAVGSSMMQKILFIPYVPKMITQVAGGIVVLGAIVSIIHSIFER